jgi:hypothetical protein
MDNKTLSNSVSLAQKISKFMSEKEYKLITPIKSIINQDSLFAYTCKCGKVYDNDFKRSWNQIYRHDLKKEKENGYYVPECCKKANIDGNYWFFIEKDSYIDKKTGEIWKEEKAYWISNKGNIINKQNGNPVKQNMAESDFYVSVNKHRFHVPSKMAELFKPEEFKGKNMDEWVIKFGKNNDLDIDANNIIFVKRSDINSVNRSNPNHTVLLGIKGICPTDKKERKNCISFIHNLTFFEDGHVWKKPENKKQGDWTTANNSTGKVKIRYTGTILDKKIDRIYELDKLIIIAFNPYNNLINYEDYNNFIIEHIDKDELNNHINNLKVLSKKLTIAEKIAIKGQEGKETRIEKNHKELNRLLEKRKAVLLSDINTIKTVSCILTYKCKCDEILASTIKNLQEIEDNTCHKCIQKEKTFVPQDPNQIFIDENGEEFIKTDICYISKNGIFKTILNRNAHTISTKDNLVKINNKEYNAKTLIAKAFKIQYHELLNGTSDFYVTTKDKTTNFAVDNLFVWSSSNERRKLIPDSHQHVVNILSNKSSQTTAQKYSKFYIKKENCKHVVLEEFLNYKFYEDGSIETATKYRTPGYISKVNKNSNGITSVYRHIIINNKTYLVHRLICFAFNPIQGLTRLSDYDNLQVNHKNIMKDNPEIINTLYNYPENLEWTTASENIQHALQEGLFGNAKPVLQFKADKNGNKLEYLKKFVSVAEAHRESRDSTEFIRNVANGKSKANFYVWEWENESNKHFQYSQPVTQTVIIEENKDKKEEQKITPKAGRPRKAKRQPIIEYDSDEEEGVFNIKPKTN